MEGRNEGELAAEIAALKQKKQIIENRLALLQNRDAIARRKAETRRRILIGAERLNRLKEGSLGEDELLAEMDAYLTRPNDRALFDLPPRQE